jgi:hypothetical protein
MLDPSVPSEEWRLSEEGRSEEHAAFVTHGTVMSLYVAGTDPDGGFGYWKTLGLPHVVKH